MHRRHVVSRRHAVNRRHAALRRQVSSFSLIMGMDVKWLVVDSTGKIQILCPKLGEFLLYNTISFKPLYELVYSQTISFIEIEIDREACV